MTIANIISYLYSYSYLIPYFKVICLAFSALFLAFIIFALLKTKWLTFILLEDLFEFFTYKPYGTKRLTKPWEKIIKRLETASEAEFKLAVIEADSILHETLKKLGYPGQTLEEILRQLSPAILPNIEQLLEFHQMRNNIVHDPDYRLTADQTRKILEVYEKALRDLEVL